MVKEAPSESNNSILTNKNRDRILNDLFCGKEGEVNSSFLYLGDGAELYEKISKDKSYPFINIENECLAKLRFNNKFLEILKHTENITDVGCGDGQKFISMMGIGEPHVLWDGKYIPADVSGPMLDIAVGNVKKNLERITVEDSIKLYDGMHLSHYLPNNMYLFLGGTICNMTDDEIIKELKNMDNNGYFTGNKILLSYFTAPNSQEEIDNLIKIYNSDSNRAFHENGMKMLGLSGEDFEFDTVYQKDNPSQSVGPFPGRIKGIIRAKRDCVVTLSDGKEIQISKGKEFTLHYSRRFTKDGIEKLFKKAKCEKVFDVDKSGDTIVLLRKKASGLSKVINKHKTALFVALLGAGMALGIGGTSAVNNYIQNRNNREKALTHWSANRLLSHDVPYQRVYYEQATNELISALRLDELNKNDKKGVIDLFNDFLNKELYNNEGIINLWVEQQFEQQNTVQFSIDKLIQDFWVQYGYVLINNYNVTHYPYDIMSHDLIWTTYKISDNLSFTPYSHTKNKAHFRGGKGGQNYGVYDVSIDSFNKNSIVLEYNDGGKEYLILKVKLRLENKYIYLGAEKKDGESYPGFSTSTINWGIKDKSGLDPEILSNTREISGNDFGDLIFSNGRVDSNGIFHSADSVPLLERRDSNQILLYENLVETPVYSIYAKNGVRYYVITIPTKGGKSVGFASTSLDGPYDINTFKELVGNFDNNYLGRTPF